MNERRIRADVEISRRRILDAAAQIAGERGYEGTSISLVSRRSGLPASSIYWYFKDKDALIAAVIDDSYARWTASLPAPDPPPPGQGPEAAFGASLEKIAGSLRQFPDFVRLGLMLVLEHRPTEPAGRRRFVEIRAGVLDLGRAILGHIYPDLDPAQVDTLARMTLALIDGYLIAAEAGELDFADTQATITHAVTSTAASLQVSGRA